MLVWHKSWHPPDICLGPSLPAEVMVVALDLSARNTLFFPLLAGIANQPRMGVTSDAGAPTYILDAGGGVPSCMNPHGLFWFCRTPSKKVSTTYDSKIKRQAFDLAVVLLTMLILLASVLAFWTHATDSHFIHDSMAAHNYHATWPTALTSTNIPFLQEIGERAAMNVSDLSGVPCRIVGIVGLVQDIDMLPMFNGSELTCLYPDVGSGGGGDSAEPPPPTITPHLSATAQQKQFMGWQAAWFVEGDGCGY